MQEVHAIELSDLDVVSNKNNKHDSTTKEDLNARYKFSVALPGDSIRKKLFLLFDDPHSSQPAFLLSIFILATVLTSVVNFIVASLPEYWDEKPAASFAIEIFCAIVFTIEYLVKILTADVWYRWAIKPLNVIDLAAVLPFYLELFLDAAVSSLGVIRAIRIIRIFRVFKMGKYSKKLTIIAKTMKQSLDTILLLVFMLIISMILFGTLIFYAEQTAQHFDKERQVWIRDEDNLESPFQSIPDSFWWAIVTMCRVPGYGAVYPASHLGKFVAALASVFGILVIAFPVAVLGQSFKDQWNENQIKKKEKKMKKRAKSMKSSREEHSESKE